MAIGFTAPLRWIWRPVSKKIEECFNPSLVRVDDFRNPKRLAKKLQEHKDTFSEYVYQQFNPEDRHRLDAYIENPELNPKFPKYLSELLNQRLKGASLYDEERFNKKELSEDTISLIGQEPIGKDLIRLNRLLLEDKYPHEIARSYLPRRVKLALALLPLLAFAAIYCWIVKGLDYYASRPRDPSKYGFEDTGKAPGWFVSNDPQRGFSLTAPGISPAYKAKGNSSMSVHVELDGTEAGRKANKHQGEVFVDPTTNKPFGMPGPIRYLDLSNKLLTTSVIIPTDKLVGRSTDKPIYIQLFLVSCDAPRKRFDSVARDINAPGQFDLEFRTNKDMNQICEIGIKIGLNSQDNNIYTGDIYVDAVDW